jgi:methyl-accepting chemotaxis protein
MKKMKVAVQMILTGSLTVAIPMGVIAFLAVGRASSGLSSVETEELTNGAKLIAANIDEVFRQETKIAVINSQDRDVVAAAAAVADASGAGNARTTGSKTAGSKGAGNSLADLISAANTRLVGLKQTKDIGEGYEVIMAVGLDGVSLAASSPDYVGKSFSERGYFRTALAGTVNIGAPVLSKVTGVPTIPIAAPILSDGRVVGVLVLGVEARFLNSLVTGVRAGKNGYAFVIDGTGLAIAHPNPENVFKINLTQLDGTKDLARKMIAGESGVSGYVFQGVAKTGGYAPVKTTGWSVGLTLTDSEFLSAANDVKDFVLIVSGVAILLAFIVNFLSARSITKQIGTEPVVMREISRRISEGDLTVDLGTRGGHEAVGAFRAMQVMTEKLKGIVVTIKESAESVASSSEEISASAQKLAEGAQGQASSLEETGASVEELSASVDQVAENAQSQAYAVERGTASMEHVRNSIEAVAQTLSKISLLAQKSVENASEGSQAVNEVVTGITLISESSQKIRGIVDVISDIADQTNLLALNASIEAARAGENGLGFAVVANEVSKLADRSAASTKEIEALIRESLKNITREVQTAKGSQSAMDQIGAASKEVKEMIAGLSLNMSQQVTLAKELSQTLAGISEMSLSISAATKEQTVTAKQVSRAVENVNELTQSAASAAEEMSSATEQLASMAQELQQMVAQFKVEAGQTRKSPVERAVKTAQEAAFPVTRLPSSIPGAVRM